MARPREFDTAEVLQRVVDVFWRKGFDKTSFSQLEKATGLKKASLFAAYGDKRAIFLRALGLYQECTAKEFAKMCGECSSASETLKAWLCKAAGGKKNDPCGRGCFILNTLIETVPHDRACAKVISSYREKLAALLETIVHRGVNSGEFRRALHSKNAAQFLICIGSGLQAIDRAQKNSRHRNRELRSVIELTLKALKS